jgi:PAS domain S-box-containing protein
MRRLKKATEADPYPSSAKNKNKTMKSNTKKTGDQPDFKLLRKKAEELLKKKVTESNSPLSEADALRLIHELEVHQIELELQNEELMQAKFKAQQSSEKYVELYDFAPTGYFTLDKESKIIETNLAGASMLGKPRSELINKYFVSFLENDEKPIFNQFLQKVFESETKEECETALTTNDEIPLWLHLSGIVSAKGKCQVNALDISLLKITAFELIKRPKPKKATF